jgi:hypothetical protein
MKGVIPSCLGQLVVNKFGKDKWEAALKLAGLKPGSTFLATQDVPDEAVLKVVDSVCKVLNISLEQAADAFGEYWVCTFAPGIYKSYYQRAASAKEFLLKMDEVHRITTDSIPNARPPRFEYTWADNKTLIMKYKSKRNLSVFMIGLVKGVGKYYKESLLVTKQGDDIKIAFL